MNYTKKWQTAVHETGHFVWACILPLSAPTLLTIEEDAASLGRCERMTLPVEELLAAELRGASLESVFKPGIAPAEIDHVLKEYRKGRRLLLHCLAQYWLAGIAAEIALLGVEKGVGNLAGADKEHVFKYGAMIAPPNQVGPWLCHELEAVTAGFRRGADAAEHIAKILVLQRTIGAAQCLELARGLGYVPPGERIRT
jgi:hypothetical protein